MLTSKLSRGHSKVFGHTSARSIADISSIQVGSQENEGEDRRKIAIEFENEFLLMYRVDIELSRCLGVVDIVWQRRRAALLRKCFWIVSHGQIGYESRQI